MAQRELDVDILRLRAEGKTYPEIAAALGCSVSVAHAHVRRAMDDARRQMAAIAHDRLAEQDARVEWLLERVSKLIAGDEVFDDKKWKVAISLLERQARLHGIDKKVDPNKGTDDWMDKASREKLEEYAQELGLSVPTTFD